MTGALITTGGAFLLIGALPVVPVVAVAYAVSGLGFGWWNVTVVARRQRITPDHLQGRVANSNRTVCWGAMPIGAALAGVLARVAGQPAVYLAGGALVLAAGLIARRSLLRATSAPDPPAARRVTARP